MDNTGIINVIFNENSFEIILEESKEKLSFDEEKFMLIIHQKKKK